MSFDEQISPAIDFIVWADKLKQVERQSSIIGGSRRENSAEHSWHVALAASTLAPIAGIEVAVGDVLRMILIHDLVEIFAGDTYAHDASEYCDQEEREETAASQIIELLPNELKARFKVDWRNFSRGLTIEARFAKAVDAAMPILINCANGGDVWVRRGTSMVSIEARIDRLITPTFPALAAHLRGVLSATLMES